MEPSNSPTATNLISQLQDLDALWDPLNPATSEAAFRALLPQVEALTGKERSYLVELVSLIARAEAFQGKLQDARASLKQAEELLIGDEFLHKASARIRWLLEKGRLHILEKTPSQARILFSEAWTLAINSGEDFFVIDIAQMMAVIEHPKSQEAWILRAIDIAENSPQPRTKRWLGSLYTSFGWKLYDIKQYEKSLETFQKALRHLKVQGSERETFVAKWSAGKVLRALGKTEEALAIQKSLLSELGIGGRRDGRLYEEVAECLHTLKHTTEAQLYFELAYRELSNDEWMKDNQPVNLQRLKDLGKVKELGKAVK